MPHVTKIAHKPKGIGAQLKSSACGESRMLLRLECQEGVVAMLAKKFRNLWRPHHTAITLRLVEPWFGSNQRIFGDSAIATLTSCIAILTFGLHFIGIVKTPSKYFPKAFFEAWHFRNTHFLLLQTLTMT
jgi:hypothetical protein